MEKHVWTVISSPKMHVNTSYVKLQPRAAEYFLSFNQAVIIKVDFTVWKFDAAIKLVCSTQSSTLTPLLSRPFYLTSLMLSYNHSMRFLLFCYFLVSSWDFRQTGSKPVLLSRLLLFPSKEVYSCFKHTHKHRTSSPLLTPQPWCVSLKVVTVRDGPADARALKR